jgi:putative transposase
MARLPRLTVPGYPHHLIQRGNNRQAVVQDDADRRFLLDLFLSTSRECKVAVHSYVLMDNHFHLLATPETAAGLPTMMQAVGRSYVRYFNDRNGRTGTLWEGRYRSTLVEADSYLLACMVYMDLNPVRAGMVQDPGDYPWSSHRHYTGRAQDRLVTPHPLFWSLGNTPFAREQAYANLAAAGVTADLQKRLTDGTLRGWAVGGESFIRALEHEGPRRPTPLTAGRPKRQPTEPVPD